MVAAYRRFDEEVLVPLPSPLHDVMAVRGTNLLANLAVLRELGREAAYYEALEPRYEQPIRELIGLNWVAIDIARAHYEAMDRLFHTPAEQQNVAYLVSRRLNSFLIQSLINPLRKAGVVTPFAIARRAPFIWGRAFNGGGLTVIQTGESALRVEVHRLSLTEVMYWRVAFCGTLRAVLSLGHPDISIILRNYRADKHVVLYDATWPALVEPRFTK